MATCDKVGWLCQRIRAVAIGSEPCAGFLPSNLSRQGRSPAAEPRAGDSGTSGPEAAGSPPLAVWKPARALTVVRLLGRQADRRSRAGDDLCGGEGEAGGQADRIPAGDQAAAAAHDEDVQGPPAGLHLVGAVAVG